MLEARTGPDPKRIVWDTTQINHDTWINKQFRDGRGPRFPATLVSLGLYTELSQAKRYTDLMRCESHDAKPLEHTGTTQGAAPHPAPNGGFGRDWGRPNIEGVGRNGTAKHIERPRAEGWYAYCGRVPSRAVSNEAGG